MSKVQATARFVVFLCITVFVSVLRAPAHVLLRPWPRLDRSWRSALFRFWAHVMWRTIGMRVRVKGSPPARPFLLVSNHLGYMDIVLLSGIVDGVFVAKADVKGWPGLGPLIALFDTIFVNRERHRDLITANAAVEKALERGDGVVIFAEGTSTDGREVLPLKPSLLDVPARTGRPVHAVRIRYTTAHGDPPAETAVCWWGTMTFFSHIFGLFGLRSFTADVSFAPEPIKRPERKVLARELRELINEQQPLPNDSTGVRI